MKFQKGIYMELTSPEVRRLMLIDLLAMKEPDLGKAMNWANAHIEQYGRFRRFTSLDLVKWNESQFIMFLKLVLMGKDNLPLTENMEIELEEVELN